MAAAAAAAAAAAGDAADSSLEERYAPCMSEQASSPPLVAAAAAALSSLSLSWWLGWAVLQQQQLQWYGIGRQLLLALAALPSREGYLFAGWYLYWDFVGGGGYH